MIPSLHMEDSDAEPNAAETPALTTVRAYATFGSYRRW